MDFFRVSTRSGKKKGRVEIYPKFIVRPSNDLMIRGGDFYAVWREDLGLWSTNEEDVIDIIDAEMEKVYADVSAKHPDEDVQVLHLWDAEAGMIDIWHKYCQKQMRDCFHPLDSKLIFSNEKANKRDYVTKKLNYPLEEGSIEAYDKLVSTLYSPEEKHKLEWAIGSIITGDSKKLQKFIVLYGEAGTGKSTVLNIIQQLFEGFYSVFDARALGSSSNTFALESFKSNPLVAIQHDGDLSHIEDNTRLNSLVSHETMAVNAKFERLYSMKFQSFLFMGTNKPVKITDAKSGILRRLIDVNPTGDKVPVKEYNKLMKQIEFELGAIAWHCREVYLEDPEYYDTYVPIAMMGATNDFWNFIDDNYLIFKNDDGITLKAAWELYKVYCDEAKTGYPMSKMRFKSELKNYFEEYLEDYILPNGTRARNYYHGFRIDKFEEKKPVSEKPSFVVNDELILDSTSDTSPLDELLKDCPAQYAKSEDDKSPRRVWDKVETKLCEINPRKLHYILVPEEMNLIFIDFDLRNENGEKDLSLNLKEAYHWPKTYGETSQGGKGVHLVYIYNGDVGQLASEYAPGIEIKVCKGKAAMRRRLSLHNDIPIATISSGLPLKEERSGRMANEFEGFKSEKGLKEFIFNNLHKKYHANTKPSVDFILKGLDEAYESGMSYDVSDMAGDVYKFCCGSTNQKDACLKMFDKMRFKSKDKLDIPVSNDKDKLIFYDCEVFKNFFGICWKYAGKDAPVVKMKNPSPADVELLLESGKLVGFNCRRYDNHILYARSMGYSNMDLYNLSQSIINKGEGFLSEGWNKSFTDVFDFAAKKQSLKKWEIELAKDGVTHHELGLKWDEEVPEELWDTVMDYCADDVLGTEAVFDHLQGDFAARKFLAVIVGGTPNDTTNSLTTRFIFGKDRNPQGEFNYRNMGDVSQIDSVMTAKVINDIFGDSEKFDEYVVFDKLGRPVFPGYEFNNGVSTYRGEEVGEGGYVYAEPGVHCLVGLDDVASMHPSSIEDEQLFGEGYTANFSAIKTMRVYIKHSKFQEAKDLMYGLLRSNHGDEKAGFIFSEIEHYFSEEYADTLSYALKIAINSVYGLTSAKFSNPFKDPRNVDNIVAKRGALFMINLKYEVQKRGYTVAHIKTDSIKVPNADNYILDFIDKYGKLYGYSFEHEATYEKMCLVNDAVYIAQYSRPETCEKMYGYIPGDNKKHFKKHDHPWTATGTQFQVPYVFKSIFSGEPIQFADLCEVKSVKTSLYLDMNEKLPDVSEYERELDKLCEKYKKGKILDTTFEPERERLEQEIAKGHNYIFVGKVSNFCPVLPGSGGGRLMRDQDGKMYSATGCKDWRWMEAEMVKTMNKEDAIDYGYFDVLFDEAVEVVDGYCKRIGKDINWFVSRDPVDEGLGPFINVPEGIDDEVPFREN